jgi:hypothetical protein
MISSSKRPERSLKPTINNMKRRTWPWLTMQIREKDRVPRVKVKEKPHRQERRKT